MRAEDAGAFNVNRVKELVPTVLAVSDVQRVLQNLLSEMVSIRHLDLIVEVLADAGRTQKDPTLLTELVRERLGLPICQALRGNQDALAVMTLDPSLESTLTHIGLIKIDGQQVYPAAASNAARSTPEGTDAVPSSDTQPSSPAERETEGEVVEQEPSLAASF